MGYIEEPKDVDLVIAGGKLTAEDRKLIRALIRKQKASKGRRVAVAKRVKRRVKVARKVTH